MADEVHSTSSMDLQFLDMSEAHHPLLSSDRSIIQSLVKPTSLPLPGDGGIWVTPRRRSPDCEFGDATAILKSLQLNPNAAVFEIPTPAEKLPPLPESVEPSAPPPEKAAKKLNAASAPFVPNIPIPLPTSHAPQTIHINNLTANLNYHLLSTDNQPTGVKMPVSSEGKQMPGQSLPIPFTVNGSYPDYVHPFQNQNYRADGYQSPVVVYQDPNINVYYPVMPQKERTVQPAPAPAPKKQEILFGSTPPVVSASGKPTEFTDGRPVVEGMASSHHYPSLPTSHQQTASPAQGPPSSVPCVQQPRPQHMQEASAPVSYAQKMAPTGGQHTVYAAQHVQQQQQAVQRGYQQQPQSLPPVHPQPQSLPPAHEQPPQALQPAHQQPHSQQPQSLPHVQQQPQSLPHSAVPSQTRIEPSVNNSGPGSISYVQATQPHPNYSQIAGRPPLAAPDVQSNTSTAHVQSPTPVYQNGLEPQLVPDHPVEHNRHSQQNEQKIAAQQEQKTADEVPASTHEAPDSSDVPEAAKSWSSLFKNQASVPNPTAVKPTARISPFTATDATTAAVVAVPTDEVESKSIELGKYLQAYKLTHYSPSLMPCGLSNRSNWCFVNAILQALVACPPFYNLFKTLPLVPGMKAGKAKSPMTESLIEFVHEFSPLETIAKPPKKEKIRKKEDFRTGPCFEPGYVYKMLLSLADDTFKVIEGRQEDAEEFLTCLLNGVSDEMTALIKLVPKEVEVENEEEEEEDVDGGDWQEVDSRGKSSVTRRVVEPAAAPVTPIQAMALGMCRSSLRAANGECSATLQPFFTLQLDIQNPEVNSVNQALLQNFDSEDIDGYICQKTKQVVEASRSLNLEELPPILILHMKRFVYDASTGGVQKVMKPIDFSVDLEVPKAVLSNEARPKFSPKQRQYKLFAVVYHTGREATKGHYVTDVYHTGYCTWLHCDDSIVTETSEQSVLTPSHTSSPYILFYRRCDTMVGLEKNKDKK